MPMKSMSATSRTSISGARHNSSAMALQSPHPSYIVALPSTLFVPPLRTATNLPHPKSLPYALNHGEFPIIATAGCHHPTRYTNRGSLGPRCHRLQQGLLAERHHDAV
ncbi:hypothetical protein GUJ93_ZPchr0015g6732 [Zizania palustris]|uniref:Uncharacterized protein n=1 Tax=Zizania palustris TaxID=103762 RepID=A0A8J5SYU9_ZIZPA|nr:hypothetical protein GUJ93_ZPchr0015g6732 [Zizania palustris]